MRRIAAAALAVALCLTYLFAVGAGLVSAHSAPPVRVRSAFRLGATAPATTVDLVYSNPPQDAERYQGALAYLARTVSPSGEVLAAPGTPASTEATAKTLAALAASGKPGPARIAAWLAGHEQKSGGFGPYPGTPPDLIDTAYALWAMALADRGAARTMPASPGRLKRAAAFILSLSTAGRGGGFDEAPDVPLVPAEANAVAIEALTALPAVGIALSSHAADAVADAVAALNHDEGVMRKTPTDFQASERWNLWRNLASARLQVASVIGLGMAYPGFGAKAGPGYRNGLDWVNANQTFNLAIAAAHVGLRATALAQFTAGLGLAQRDGGFGSAYHPPVGPETGGYSAGPGAPTPGATADFLLAADTLLRDHILGLDGTLLRVLINGRPETEYPGDGVVDPPLTYAHQARVAVLISSAVVRLHGQPATDQSSEEGLSVNLAAELVRLGYPVTLFWYKPNQAGPFHPLADLWAHLDQFQVLALSPGTFLHDDGFGPAIARHRYAIGAWLRRGGRLLDVGDPHGVPVDAPWALTPAPTGPYRLIRWNRAIIPVPSVAPGPELPWVPLRPVAFPLAGHAWKALAWTGARTPVAVAVGRAIGKGRVVLTGLGLGTRRRDGSWILAALMAWDSGGLSLPQPAPVNPAKAVASLVSRILAAFRLGTGDRFSGTAAPAPHRGPTYLWPLSQLLDGSSAAGGLIPSARRLAEMAANGLPAYWDARLNPPGYAASPLAPGKGGLAFYDDNGWVALALLRLFNATGNPFYRARAEALFTFMASGWSRNGGEYFNILRQNRTQTATGTFLELALRLYRLTHDAQYLTWAHTITAWDRHALKGPTGLYWDSLAANGVAKGPALAYDTGVVLDADVLHYQATGNPLFLDRARILAGQAMQAFTDPLTGRLVDPAGLSSLAFNAVLIHGLALLNAVSPRPAYRRIIAFEIDTLVRQDRSPNGLYGSDASGLAGSGLRSLLVQAAVLKVLAQALGTRQ